MGAYCASAKRLSLVAVALVAIAQGASAQICLQDALPADFAAGTNDGTVAAADVSLAPALDESFGDAELPPAWTVSPWTGGTSEPVDGSLFTDGALVATAATYPAGRTLEFTATFAAEAYQHVGFGVDLNGAPWAIISTGGLGDQLYARTLSCRGQLRHADRARGPVRAAHIPDRLERGCGRLLRRRRADRVARDRDRALDARRRQ